MKPVMERGEDKKKRVEDLEKEIKGAKKEIEQIQSDCSHKEIELKPISEGGKDIRKVCIKCGKPVGYPGKQDLDNYISK